MHRHFRELQEGFSECVGRFSTLNAFSSVIKEADFQLQALFKFYYLLGRILPRYKHVYL